MAERAEQPNPGRDRKPPQGQSDGWSQSEPCVSETHDSVWVEEIVKLEEHEEGVENKTALMRQAFPTTSFKSTSRDSGRRESWVQDRARKAARPGALDRREENPRLQRHVNAAGEIRNNWLW